MSRKQIVKMFVVPPPRKASISLARVALSRNGNENLLENKPEREEIIMKHIMKRVEDEKYSF